MRYRMLGKTGMKVSVLGYGAAALGGAYGDFSETEGIRTVHTALDLGINFIDVAPYYGRTKAETVLGKALRSVPRERYYLSTKVGRYDLAEFDFSAARVIASVDESMARLGVGYLDLILCHDIEFGSIPQVVEETLPALETLRKQGKVRYLGVSGLPLKIYPSVLDRIALDAIISYCHYTLNDASLADLIPYLQAKGVGVINASPLGMGLLTGQSPPSWHPAPALIRQTCEQAADFCCTEGVSIAKLAVQFASANPAIATTLSGAAKPDEIEQNIRWVAEPIDQEVLAKVLAILAPIRGQSWPSGRSENN